jgi:predicted oxidoreductase
MKNITLKENKMKKEDLKQIIKEEIKNILKEEAATPTTKQAMDVTTISKDLEDRESNFKNITNKDKIVQLLNDIADKLGPKTVESPAFKQAVYAFYSKHK